MLLSLLTLLPVAILVLAALWILILRQTRPSVGYPWLIASLGGLLAAAAMLFLRWQLPLQLAAERWRPFGTFSSPPVFRLDFSSWPYAFGLVLAALAFILTDSARLETEARPLNWAAGLALAGVGLLAVMAGSPVTLVLTWTAVDSFELVMILVTEAGRRMGQQTIAAFSVRVAGTLLVLLAIFVARSQGLPFDLDPVPGALSLYLLLAAGLRLGVLPLNVPYAREVYAWRGLGNVLRMIGPASALVVLGRLPPEAMPAVLEPLFLAFSALAAVFGAVMWLLADNELNGRPYWFIALAALAVASVVNGSPAASIAWGMVLIFAGSVLFYYSASRRRNMLLPGLAMASILGLPYTPAAPGWAGVAGPTPGLFSLFSLLAVVLLFGGYLRHALRPREELHRKERWVHTVYPAGLLFLLAGHWVVGVFGSPGALAPGLWWASTAAALVMGLCFGLAFFFRRRFGRDAVTSRWAAVFARRLGAVLGDFFRMNWLYRFLAWVYQVMQNLVQLVTAVFEGDGGILWSLVMLALLVSLIWSRGAP
jgi:hypothetical protein